MPPSAPLDDDELAALRGRLGALTAFCSVLAGSMPVLSRASLARQFEAVSRRLEANALASSMPDVELDEMMQAVANLQSVLQRPSRDAVEVDLVAALTERKLAFLARSLPTRQSRRALPRPTTPPGA